jgi:hypothetical protein
MELVVVDSPDRTDGNDRIDRQSGTHWSPEPDREPVRKS